MTDDTAESDWLSNTNLGIVDGARARAARAIAEPMAIANQLDDLIAWAGEEQNPEIRVGMFLGAAVGLAAVEGRN